MADSSIEWTDKTWNPVRGCSLISPGCANCYAMKFAHRFSAPGQPYEGLTRLRSKGRGPVWTGEARFIREMLEAPLTWKKPARIFVNSMSDLFHEDIAFEDIAAVFGVMASCPQHTFQVLTKRAERMVEFFRWLPVEEDGKHRFASWKIYEEAKRCGVTGLKIRPAFGWPLPNVWLGVSVEDQQTSYRIELLKQLPAMVRFVSFEPLLGPVYYTQFGDPDCKKCEGRGYVREYSNCACGDPPEPDEEEQASGWCDEQHEWPCGCAKIHWVILGGESGQGARPCHLNHLGPIQHAARLQGVRVFVKQLGARPDVTDSEFGTAFSDSGFASYPTRPDPKAPGRLLLALKHHKGSDSSEWPEDLRERAFPEVKL